MLTILENILDMALKAAPWLLVGLIAAGLIRAFVPQKLVARVLGGEGAGSILKASMIGIPLPLCSCGVLPTAIGLRRQGASKSSTVSFLISTPEIGLDSFALSYVLLGPFMAIVRPIAAFCSAVFAGVLAAIASSKEEADDDQVEQGEMNETAKTGPETAPMIGPAPRPKVKPGLGERLREGVGYVMNTLLGDITFWLVVAVIVAGVMKAFLPGVADAEDSWLTEMGSAWYAKWAMLAIGIPLYVCASASTPIAASLLFAGVSPGTVLVFLLAGPATNIGSIGVLNKELGKPVMVAYLVGIAVTSVAAGYAVDGIVGLWGVEVAAQIEHAHDIIPVWLSWPSLVILAAFMIKPLRQRYLSPFLFGMARPVGKVAGGSCCSAGVMTEEKASCCSSSNTPSTSPSCCSTETKTAESTSCCSEKNEDG